MDHGKLEAHVRVRIRDALEEDLAALEWWGWFASHRRAIRGAFEAHRRGTGHMLVAEADGTPVGQAWIDFAPKAPEVAVVWALRVLPGLRGAGIGSVLVRTSEAVARQRGAACVVGVREDNAGARRLYERLGYAPVGETTGEVIAVDPDGCEHVERFVQVLLRRELGSS